MPRFLATLPGGPTLLVEAGDEVGAAREAVRLWFDRLPPNPAQLAALVTVEVIGPAGKLLSVLVRYRWRFEVEPVSEEG